MIYLDQTIEAPDGTDLSYGIAHLHEGQYASIDLACSWDYSASANITYWCYWADLLSFINTMLGTNEVIEEGGTKRYSRFLPHRFPGTLQNLWASRILSIKGIAGEEDVDGTLVRYPRFSTDGISFYYAAVTVQYEPSPWPMKTDTEVEPDEEWNRFTTIQKTPRLDYITYPANTFRFVGLDAAVPHGLPLREQSVDYLVTFHRVPEAFFNPADYIGYANSSAGFLAGHPQVPTAGFAANTMQLMGVQEIIKPVAFTDDVLYDFQYFFQYRPNGFNKIRFANTNAKTFNYTEFSLDGIVPVSNATRAVPLIDMALLFQPNA